MTDAVIVSAVRTPVGIGKPGKGALSDIHPVDLSAHVLREVVLRAGLDPAEIDDVIWGCVSAVGEQSANIARNALLAAGFPESVPGVTIDRQCGSSQQAVSFAAALVASGQAEIVIAGGVEVMSRVPLGSAMAGGDGPFSELLTSRYEDGLVHQGISAELIAKHWNLSRTYLDELSVASHERAAAAAMAGNFDAEIVAVGEVNADQGIRPDTTVERLAALKPAFMETGVVTAGNSSQISDGAAAVVVMSAAAAKARGITPLVRVHSVAMAGVDPVMMLTAPMPATVKVLNRAGLSMSDIGAFEVNEAFASVLGAWYADTGANPELVNAWGGAIALGHPVGASGARLMTTLIHRMRMSHTRYGLQTMCEGGGMANATILELV
jgi:acetyl-CoA acyltransferase